MNVLYTTHSTSLRVFDGLHAALAKRATIERSGFTVADSLFYRQWTEDNPRFESAGHALLKEWEVTARRRGKPDLELLARYEREVGGEAGLFGAIVADRRLFMGPDCSYTQDYRRRFTDDELLCILQEGLIATERLFDTVEPDVVIGFICVTFLEYLAYLFARARGVQVLNLRPTRIGNHVTFGSVLNDPAPEFVRAYRRALRDGSPKAAAASAYIHRVREQHGLYEGVVSPSAKPALAVNPDRDKPWTAARRVVRNYRRYRSSNAPTDNHVPDPLRSLMFAAVINPARAAMTEQRLRKRYVSAKRISQMRYVFYPLHTEPEVSLLVYGRPFLNQIEVIRQIAISLPIDVHLVVKEHPWMVGKRTYSSYAKLLNIPRVHLARPETAARVLISGSALVTVITGSAGLEAAILRKPVITFGDCAFNALPSTIVRRCSDLRELPSLVRTMLDHHEHDESALESYVAAALELSESVNLYSVLLDKKGVYREQTSSFTAEVEKLADYAMSCMQQGRSDSAIEPAAAAW
jgi:capsular polysaccharide biosynthesis protein